MSHSSPETKEFFEKHTLKAILIAPLLYPNITKWGQTNAMPEKNIQKLMQKSEE